MAEWSEVVVWSQRDLYWPKFCSGCLKDTETSMRVDGDKGGLTGFYLVAIKTEHVSVNIPFGTRCANRQQRWVRWDSALLIITAITALSLAAWLGYLLNAGAREFWMIFLVAADARASD
jgi:hypothetical protein